MSKTYILNSYSHSNATSWKVLANLHFFLVRRCWLEFLLQLFLDSKHHFELSLCWERVTLVLISCPIICVIFQENV